MFFLLPYFRQMVPRETRGSVAVIQAIIHIWGGGKETLWTQQEQQTDANEHDVLVQASGKQD